MKNKDEIELDQYELARETKFQELRSCQNEKSFRSCRECEEFYTCQLRRDYVDAVFNSMSKGETGGFEF